MKKKSENEIRKPFLFTIASKITKYLGINLIKTYKTYTLKTTKYR